MPVVGVNRDKLFEALGQTYSKPRCAAQANAWHGAAFKSRALTCLCWLSCSRGGV
jgi:hypothetical protein